MATMTLTGLYNYNNNLFSKLSLPAGIDKDIAIGAILQTSGEFEVLYPDYDFCKEMIGVINKKWNRTFTKWYNALQLTYDPIYNYDRYESWTDTGSGSNSASSTNDTTADNLVNAYNNNALTENEQNKASTAGSQSGDYKDSNTHTGRIYGNIGVTTSQQMLQAELDLARFNLYQQIADIFVKELCIPIYG